MSRRVFFEMLLALFFVPVIARAQPNVWVRQEKAKIGPDVPVMR